MSRGDPVGLMENRNKCGVMGGLGMPSPLPLMLVRSGRVIVIPDFLSHPGQVGWILAIIDHPTAAGNS